VILDVLILNFFIVECSPGTFYDNGTQTCPQCIKGYYQDQSGEDFCIRCPHNTTTKLIGAKNITECIGNGYILESTFS
jgi:hypothetical protein